MNENEVKIIKLPTIGEPFSYKTIKQGRNYRISDDIKISNSMEKSRLKKISRIESAEKNVSDDNVREFLFNYRGSNAFIRCVSKQLRVKGFKRLSQDQITAIKRVIREGKF